MKRKIAHLCQQAGIFILAFGFHSSVSAQEQEADPWQGYNRAMFSFNDYVDRYTLKPLAKGYVFITPKFVRKGVHNVLSNVGEVPTIINGILQGKPGQA